MYQPHAIDAGAPLPRPARLLLLSADEPPALPPLPADRAVTWPDGVTMPLLERGVHRLPFLIGTDMVVVAADSTGDTRNMVRRLPLTANAAELAATEAELWVLLDKADPLPAPRRVG